jgi:hypothetical protein
VQHHFNDIAGRIVSMYENYEHLLQVSQRSEARQRTSSKQDTLRWSWTLRVPVITFLVVFLGKQNSQVDQQTDTAEVLKLREELERSTHLVQNLQQELLQRQHQETSSQLSLVQDTPALFDEEDLHEEQDHTFRLGKYVRNFKASTQQQQKLLDQIRQQSECRDDAWANIMCNKEAQYSKKNENVLTTNTKCGKQVRAFWEAFVTCGVYHKTKHVKNFLISQPALITTTNDDSTRYYNVLQRMFEITRLIYKEPDKTKQHLYWCAVQSKWATYVASGCPCKEGREVGDAHGYC